MSVPHYVFNSGLIPAYGNDLQPPIEDVSTSESETESIFSNDSDGSNVTIDLYPISMIVLYPNIPLIGQLQTLHFVEVPAPFLDIDIYELFKPQMGWFFEDQFSKVGVMMFVYRENGAGARNFRQIHHPLIRNPQLQQTRWIEQMVIENGELGLRVQLIFPWYAQPINIIKGVFTIATIAVLSDLILCMLLLMCGMGVRMVALGAVMARPCTALMLAIACQLVVRAYHGKHVIGIQDYCIYGGIYCTCRG
ncbi:hypothetical protein TWF481_005085 [Arthrobotrys musiformis]|uniref:Uncharacterized protein n=1 Tax=Arthrobotrys musiformis TaxID=47236 RepID=A0AAV9WCM5_9PEZI